MKLLIAGDFAPRARLAKQIEEKRYGEIFPDGLRSIIRSADFSFVNFESPVVEDGYKPITKCGPNLRCTPEAAEAVKYAGFTGVTMANNHILDFGVEGMKKSLECCKAQGLNVVGVGDNLEDAERTLYIEKDGKRLGVVNCCEHEFSTATAESAGANPLNPVRQFYAIQKACKNADYVLVIVHGGHEHYQLPSPRMQETYRFFIDSGADAVVNHHQHCYSGYEVYNGKPIFYGLGNFCFDSAPDAGESTWYYGYLLELVFNDTIEYKIYPYKQYGENATVELLDESSFEKHLDELNSIILNDSLLNKHVERYYQQCETYECSVLEPYSNKFMRKLFMINVLPKFIRGKKISSILNHVDCEAHRDKLLYALKRNNK